VGGKGDSLSLPTKEKKTRKEFRHRQRGVSPARKGRKGAFVHRKKNGATEGNPFLTSLTLQDGDIEELTAQAAKGRRGMANRKGGRGTLRAAESSGTAGGKIVGEPDGPR